MLLLSSCFFHSYIEFVHLGLFSCLYFYVSCILSVEVFSMLSIFNVVVKLSYVVQTFNPQF